KEAAYWTNDATSGTPVLFLHGFRGNHHGLTKVAAVFREDRRVVMPDLPGYGASEKLDVRHTFSAYSAWLEQFFKETGVRRVHLVGHSFGGTLAIVFAAQHPDRVKKVALISPVIYANTLEANLGKLYYQAARVLPWPLKRVWLTSRVADYISNLMLLKTSSINRRRQLMRSGQRNLKKLDERVVMENFLSFYSTDALGLARRITAPTAVIVGEADRIAPLGAMIDLHHRINGSRLEVLPRAGHIAPLEQPLTVGNVVKKFIES